MSALQIAQATILGIFALLCIGAGITGIVVALRRKPSTSRRAADRALSCTVNDTIAVIGQQAEDELVDSDTEEVIPVRVDFNTISPRQGVH